MEQKNKNAFFPFMIIGSSVYAFFYTLFLYKNSAGITYPFFVGGTCLFFFYYLKKSGVTAKKFSIFLTISIMLLGVSTCLTDSWVLHFFNKLGIMLLFFYMVLHNLYEDTTWDITKYLCSFINITCSSLLYIHHPILDLSEYYKEHAQEEHKQYGKLKYIFFGILISLPLLLIVLLLLCSADAVFSNIFSFMTTDFLEQLLNGNVTGIFLMFLFAFIMSYAIITRISVHNIEESVTDKRSLEPIMGITITAIFSFVYSVFCGIQIVYLFGGLGTLPENYTYASYAREGFFQLVFVCIINLVLVLVCIKYFRSNKILKVLLAFISICTFIMIASSIYRMLLYISVFYLTFLRVFVLWSLLVILLLMIGTFILIYNDKFPMVRYCLITVTSLYLVFSFAHPDYWIAKYNIERSYSSSESVNTEYNSFNDYSYFYNLSLDAAPVIYENAQILDYTEDYWFEDYCNIVKDKENDTNVKSILSSKKSIRKWNLSRWTAFQLNQY